MNPDRQTVPERVSDAFRSGRSSGFTLLEVMIALAVVGALLTTLIYSLNTHLEVADRHETLTVATMLARGKLVELRKDPSKGEGRFEEPYEDYTYEAEIEEGPYPGISELSVAVQKGRERVVLREFVRGEALGDE